MTSNLKSVGRSETVVTAKRTITLVNDRPRSGLAARTIHFMECSNTCPPKSTSDHILLRVPEGTFVHGIHIHRAVVAPAGGDSLRARAVNQRDLTIKRPERICGRTTCIANLGEYRAAR